MDKKIYSPWAFSESEGERCRINLEIYNELKQKYKVYRHDTKFSPQDGEDCNFADYDVIIGRKPGYLHSVYRVWKNAPGLSIRELALLCDCRNLCFGYVVEDGDIRVSED